MTNVRSGLLTVLALAMTVAAAPAQAQHHARHPGHEARAQALEPGEGMMTPEREKALRDCSALGNRFLQKDWGVMQGQEMRSCMAEHGQTE